MAQRYDLRGKTVLITGAARGIGFETARIAHSRGASVVVIDVHQEEIEAAATAIGADRALAIAADVTDREAMAAAVDRAVERFGRLDVVVANAGVSAPLTTHRAVDADVYERVVEIDLLGVWRTVKPALEHVIANQGHVVVISSVYAWINGALAGAYAAGKSGVEAMGRGLRTELALHGASATVAHFGFIDTRMVADAVSDPIGARREQAVPGVLRKRLQPSDAAAGIVDAIERRAARVILPRRWRVWYALRGILNPLIDEHFARDKEVRESMTAAEAPDRAGLTGGLKHVDADRAQA